jgi:hypothetical protein
VTRLHKAHPIVMTFHAQVCDVDNEDSQNFCDSG